MTSRTLTLLAAGLATGLAAVLAAAFATATPLLAQERPSAGAGGQEFIRAASAAAPGHISDQATIARLEPSGQATVVRQGSNGFTCTIIPDGSNAPVCADKNGFAWLVSAVSKQPKPSNAEPGVGYMAQGGVHFETADGAIVMEPSAETKQVKEPAHWMLLWPVDPATSGLPARPNAGGVYVMWAGTPYAHLMVYQNPNMIGK